VRKEGAVYPPIGNGHRFRRRRHLGLVRPLVSWFRATHLRPFRRLLRTRLTGTPEVINSPVGVSTDKRACVDRTDQLPDGQLESSLENGVLDSMHERSSWISVTQACAQ
jgi:hypothetical protein